MKVLKSVLYVILGLIALFLIIAIFLPSEVRVERSIVIEKSPSLVYSLVADLNHYKEWNPWSKMDPAAMGELTGEGGKIGQVWSWDGKIVGKGSLTTTELIPNKFIKGKLEFFEPYEGWSWDIWNFDNEGNGTKVTWANESELDYPVGRYFGLFYDGMIGPDFEKGLASLKELCNAAEEVDAGNEVLTDKEMLKNKMGNADKTPPPPPKTIVKKDMQKLKKKTPAKKSKN